MKLQELFTVIPSMLCIEIRDCYTSRPLTNKTCFAFRDTELEKCTDYEVTEINIKLDKCQTPFLQIWIDRKVLNDCRSE